MAKGNRSGKAGGTYKKRAWIAGSAALVFVSAAVYALSFGKAFQVDYYASADTKTSPWLIHSDPQMPRMLDRAAYDQKMLLLAHVNLSATSSTSTSARRLWPVASAPYPLAGALLPFNRIVAYYGNFYSTGMGVLGEYPPATVLAMLASTTRQWQLADPSTPVVPAIDYIAVTAQGSAGPDKMYRARMPADQIQKAIDMANSINGIVVLDVQVGLSNVQTEIPLLKQFLQLPNVELAIDPEFSMKDKTPPGREIGTFDASDIDWTAGYLAHIVQENNLPPKILVVHRFTEGMVTNYKKITPLPEVQIVMDMDGWGFPAKKINTYNYVIAPEPVQFTGFKLFYKADLRPPSVRMLTPAEVLKLTPSPIFIQYQ